MSGVSINGGSNNIARNITVIKNGEPIGKVDINGGTANDAENLTVTNRQPGIQV